MAKKQDLLVAAVLLCIMFVVLLIADLFFDLYVRRILNLCAIYTILGLSMNLINGFTGLFSLGHAGFMGIGAYIVAIFTVPIAMRAQVFYLKPMHPAIANIQLPFIVAVILGGLLAAVAAFIIGAPVLRLKGDYLAIATLGFSEIIRIVITNAQTITNGPLGIKDIPPVSNLWLIYGITLVSVVIIILLINSSYGRAFKAIREDEVAAEAMGINLFKHKMLSFMVGAFFAGIGGGLFGALLGTVDPKQFMFTLTYNILLIIVLGGMGSVSGSIISAFIVTGGLEFLRVLDEPLDLGFVVIPFRPGLRMVVFSLLLMIIVLFYRNGLMGNKEFTWDFFRGIFKRKQVKQGGAK